MTLTVTLPGPVPAGSRWYKYQNGSWSSLPIGGGGTSVITVTFQDGGAGDAVMTPDGQIIDPGGPSGGGAVGWETFPISKVRVLLPWIALGLGIVAAISVLAFRRRRTIT